MVRPLSLFLVPTGIFTTPGDSTSGPSEITNGSEAPPTSGAPHMKELLNLTSWYRFIRSVTRMALWTLGPLQVEGNDRLPSGQPIVIVANHSSYLDGPILGVVSPRPLTFFSAAWLFRVPTVSWFLRSMGAISTGNPHGLRHALRLLKAGGAVALFPEGGITNKLDKYGDGAVFLASRSGAVLVPVAIHGADNVLPPNAIIPRRRAPLRVVIGNPRNVPPDLTRHQLNSYMDDIMNEVAAL